MNYTAVIRTLGKAGAKYQKLLDSLASQTIKPKEILVYIAEGYDIPKETIGIEKYIYVKKGMVAQRALPYEEVKTDYILFLDDDVYFPNDGVEKLINNLIKYDAHIISPDVFENHKRPKRTLLLMALSGRMLKRGSDDWGYKVMQTTGFSFNGNPKKNIYPSQTNAGPCFLCKKEVFLSIHFEDELWLDEQKYPIGEDQVMFYKMHLMGYKQLTLYNSGILHLDAGGNLSSLNKEKNERLVYADYRFRLIFWHRFLYPFNKSLVSKLWSSLSIIYIISFGILISLIKLQFKTAHIKYNAIKEGLKFNKKQSGISLIRQLKK